LNYVWRENNVCINILNVLGGVDLNLMFTFVYFLVITISFCTYDISSYFKIILGKLLNLPLNDEYDTQLIIVFKL